MAVISRLDPVPLWTKMPQAELAKRKADDARSYSRGYEMRAYDDSERMFPSFEACRVRVGKVQAEQAGWPMFTGVDLASEKRPGTCIFTIAVNPANHARHPVSVRAGRWSSPDTVSQLAAELNQYPQIQIIMVENNAYQQALIDWIRVIQASRVWLKVEPFTTTGHNKIDPIIGLPSLEAEFHKRAWVIPWNEYEHHPPGHGGPGCGWCLWDMEMKNYPHHPTTDTVMATWFAREAVSRWLGIAAATRQGTGGQQNVR